MTTRPESLPCVRFRSFPCRLPRAAACEWLATAMSRARGRRRCSPEVRAAQRRRMIMPVDPVSDGTWIGVNDAGFIAVLLNAYPASSVAAAPAQVDQPLVSRGTIIPSLLGSDCFDQLVEQALAIDTRRFAAFRLVLADSQEVAEVGWAGLRSGLKSRMRADRPADVYFVRAGGRTGRSSTARALPPLVPRSGGLVDGARRLSSTPMARRARVKRLHEPRGRLHRELHGRRDCRHCGDVELPSSAAESAVGSKG